LHGFGVTVEFPDGEPAWRESCIIQSGRWEMAFGKKELIRELKHEINSPLAAIRNALYL
jgi:hypothetical protein